MKQIRNGVFETNSSSSHSVNISSTGDIDTSLIPNLAGVLIIDGYKQFGWEVEEYNDATTKAIYSYLQAQYSKNKEYIDMVFDVIKTQTGADEVIFLADINAGWDSRLHGYIDHQSTYNEECFEPFENKEALRYFIFNTNSILKTDNDNH